jgi:microcin C transport system permease protein
MIERWITNELSLRRWRRFTSNKRAVVSCWTLGCLIVLSATAELWANSKPLILRYQGTTYYPAFRYYHPTVFGRRDLLQMDYRSLSLGERDWVLWSPLRWDPFERNDHVEAWPSPPTTANLLGTDANGRDVLTRLLYGFRYSFAFAFSVWLCSSAIGITIGATMGYFGAFIDLFGQRCMEVFESLPYFLLLITLIAMFSPHVFWLILLNTIFGWMGICQYTRGEMLKLRQREFVEAARAYGASTRRIIFKHCLVNGLTPWLTLSPFMLSGLIATLAALDYLGFGLPPPTPSWGELFNQAQQYFRIAWWLALFPAAALFLTLLVLNMIGEGVRAALDPRAS